MEKLLNLLNEYEEKRIKKINADGKLRVKLLFKPYTKEALTNQAYQSVQNEIISKYYGFIKRLVDKDKIDRHSKELELDMKRMRIPQDYYISGVQSLDLQHKKAQYLSLIALLSIQDRPIEFLIGILK